MGLVDIFNALRAVARILLKWNGPLTAILPWLAPLGALLGMLATLSAVADQVTGSINVLAASLRGIPSSSLVAMANTLFPVSEAILIYGTLLTLRITCISVRLIKSWIPSVN